MFQWNFAKDIHKVYYYVIGTQSRSCSNLKRLSLYLQTARKINLEGKEILKRLRKLEKFEYKSDLSELQYAVKQLFTIHPNIIYT
jgi:hypothetical protein